ncbi:hypothetical protein FHW36_11042 [Chitinophaga polysaccharea]|uniref:PXPV repeat-containing protein n=1 Tax=Chitinophaga polysaccharea TaxID=1293035 RepID=A0A561P9N9_9BACT|nr:hypothetical protein [Chitinophaga polysaccharea]TWF34844.1 hypothetical protein FHW36_11042 [Chitinophaga polysaccharea]
MKKVMLMMLLIGGTVFTASAQRGWGHDRGRGHGRWERERCDRDDDRWERRRECRRDWDDDECYRPRRRVVYAEPAYYPVVPVPVPVPAPRYYPSRPRAVFHAGVTIVN